MRIAIFGQVTPVAMEADAVQHLCEIVQAVLGF